jgi:hypothetical protein
VSETPVPELPGDAQSLPVLLRRALPFLRPYRARLLGAIGLVVAFTVCHLA